MYEINREAFASFLTQLRKEQGWTQKDLAERLYVSDKAVSKWERGLSMPDISLLIPLAENLGVTVTELLEGRRMENPEPMAAEQVEELVKKTITLSEGGPREALGSKLAIFGGAAVLMLLENLVLYWTKGSAVTASGSVFQILALVFGVYFWFFMEARLPDYYDQNRISAFSDGPIRMNIPGVYFNNGNWPHIRKFLRFWSVGVMIAGPVLNLALGLLPSRWLLAGEMLLLVLFLGSLFLPVMVLGRTYDSGKMEGKQGRRWLALTLTLVALAAVLFAAAGPATSYSGVRIGYVQSGGSSQWSASYRRLDGELGRTLFLADTPVPYTLTVETEEGSLSILITGGEGVIFSQTELSSGTYELMLEGTIRIQMEAQNHRGSFSLLPQ